MQQQRASAAGFGRFQASLGAVLLLVCAYQRARATEPLNLISSDAAQLAGSFALLCLGITLTAAPLRPITWQAELRKHTIDQSDSRLGFANIHHRGTLLYRDD